MTSLPHAGQYIYTVKSEDTLRKVSWQCYQNGDKWPFIAVTNNIKSQQIREGQRIIIPRLWGAFTDYRYPYMYPPDVALEIDLDFDGVPEEITFTPYQTERNLEDDKEQYIICLIKKQQKLVLTFPVDAYWGGTVTVQDVVAWSVPEHAHILAVKTWNDHWAAVASASGTIHFFLLSADMTMKRLAAIEGDGEQHHSASSGSSEKTTFSCVTDLKTLFFEVEHIYEYGETTDEKKDGKCYTKEYGETQTTTYTLYYEPQEQTLSKQNVHIDHDKDTYREEYSCPTW